jgi:hypothetical protein
MINFEDMSIKEILFALCVSYPGGIFFILLGLVYFNHVRKTYDKNDTGAISPYNEAIFTSIGIVIMGFGILIYKIFW